MSDQNPQMALLNEISAKVQQVVDSSGDDRLSAVLTLVQNLQQSIQDSNQPTQNNDGLIAQVMQEVASLANQFDSIEAKVDNILGIVSISGSGGLA